MRLFLALLRLGLMRLRLVQLLPDSTEEGSRVLVIGQCQDTSFSASTNRKEVLGSRTLFQLFENLLFVLLHYSSPLTHALVKTFAANSLRNQHMSSSMSNLRSAGIRTCRCIHVTTAESTVISNHEDWGSN
ncbi:unnamed protein product [Ectocarpus sp. 12 AP-2014]